MTYEDFKKTYKYNFHCLLYDLTKGHFKSKLFCKLGKHNYIMYLKQKCEEEIINDESTTIVKYHKKFLTYFKCSCCGEKIEIKE